jgi:rare lipoprotein A
MRYAGWFPQGRPRWLTGFSIFDFRFLILLSLSATIGITGCAHKHPPQVATAAETQPEPEREERREEPVKEPKAQQKKLHKIPVEKGIASWYGEPYHGRQTASGEIYDMHRMTAAHRTLDFGTMVKVTRRDDGASVKVRINDRGPFIKGRIIDLSFAAAKKIGLDVDGVAPVKVEVVGFREPSPRKKGSSQPPITPAECWWVQVGAFSDETNAARVERALEDRGEPTISMESPDGLSRVRVGPYDKEKEAEKALKRVRKLYPASQLVPCG